MKFQSMITMGLIFASLSVHAKGLKMTLDTSGLPKGVDKVQAAKILKRLAPTREKRMAQKKAMRDKLMADISKVTKPARERLLKAAKSSVNDQKALDSYFSEAKAAAKLQGKQKKAAQQSLKKRYRKLFSHLFKKAQINEQQVKEKVELIIADSDLAKDGRLHHYSLVAHWSEFLSLFIQWLQQNEQPEPQQDPLIVTLDPPFPNRQESQSILGVVSINTNAGRYSVRQSAFGIGGADSLAGLGHFFRVPGDFSSARVTAALPDLEYRIFAGATPGVSGAYASSTVEIFSNNEIVCEQQFDHGFVIAPLLWLAEDNGVDTFNITCDFEAPAQEEEIVLSFYSTAGAWGALLGAAQADVTSTPRDLVVRLEE